MVDHRLHKQCEVLLSALVNREVSTRDSLFKVWKTEPQCEWYTMSCIESISITVSTLQHSADILYTCCVDLLKAYSMWLPEDKHKTLASLWPPCDELNS